MYIVPQTRNNDPFEQLRQRNRDLRIRPECGVLKASSFNSGMCCAQPNSNLFRKTKCYPPPFCSKPCYCVYTPSLPERGNVNTANITLAMVLTPRFFWLPHSARTQDETLSPQEKDVLRLCRVKTCSAVSCSAPLRLPANHSSSCSCYVYSITCAESACCRSSSRTGCI